MKKWIAIALLACILCSLLAGCGKKEPITADQAYQVVLDHLGALADTAAEAHIHQGTYDDKPCFNIYVTVNGLPMQYIVSETGKLLYEGPGEHSH